MSGHVVPSKVYFAIFATLIVLTGLTVAAAMVDLGPLNTVVAMSIACAKATLVVLYFMHARYGSRLIWVMLCAGVLWLIILIALTMGDYATRGWMKQSARQVGAVTAPRLAAVSPFPERQRGEDRGPRERIDVEAQVSGRRLVVAFHDDSVIGPGGIETGGVRCPEMFGQRPVMRHHGASDSFTRGLASSATRIARSGVARTGRSLRTAPA